jgi:uncharacterized protein VirK/YbjX
MAATDYVIVTGWMNAYLTKKKKPTKKGPQTMSEDRRPITEGEMIGLFEFYLRKWCEEHEGEDTVVITNSEGKKIFEATLLDKEDKEL